MIGEIVDCATFCNWYWYATLIGVVIFSQIWFGK